MKQKLNKKNKYKGEQRSTSIEEFKEKERIFVERMDKKKLMHK